MDNTLQQILTYLFQVQAHVQQLDKRATEAEAKVVTQQEIIDRLSEPQKP